MEKLEKTIGAHPEYQKKVNHFFTQFEQFIESYEISVKDKWLFAQAFMHSSFINDLKLMRIYNNERLEFLGDAVLELKVSNYLFNRFPHLQEGELTKLRAKIVCEPSLVVFANQLNLKDMLLLGKGEEKTGGRNRPSIIADNFEALMGALFLDQGHEVVQTFLERTVFPEIIDEHYDVVIDYKTTLQEKVHKSDGEFVSYKLLEETGPSHDKRFHTGVYLRDTLLGEGTGRSKKESEQNAAENALSKQV